MPFPALLDRSAATGLPLALPSAAARGAPFVAAAQILPAESEIGML